MARPNLPPRTPAALPARSVQLRPTAPPPAPEPSIDADGVLLVERESESELSEVLAGFKNRAKRESERTDDATDSEYWVALCFQTRAQKDEFLTALNLVRFGDKYLDGMKVAATLGVTLTSPVPPPRRLKADPRLTALTLPRR